MFIAPEMDPFDAFLAVWDRVRATAPAGFDPATVALGTADASGRPAVRMVLLRNADPGGFTFFTNYESRKGADLGANPRAALCGFWFWLKQQVRIEGTVTRAPAEESDAYFGSRPRGSQLGAWASPQSAALAARGELEARLRSVDERFSGQPVPRPAFWGGYRLRPDRFEFWEEGDNRLHERLLFTPSAHGWTRTWLAP